MFNKIKDLYASIGRPTLCNPFRRKVSIVYSSVWLSGNYVFTFKVGERDLRTKLVDHMIGNMGDQYGSKDYASARALPGIKIVDIF
jgi:hypothetical protein